MLRGLVDVIEKTYAATSDISSTADLPPNGLFVAKVSQVPNKPSIPTYSIAHFRSAVAVWDIL